MAVEKLMTRIISRNDTAENWRINNPILLKGEIGIEIDTNKLKVGDGVSSWNSLAYISGTSSSFNPSNGALLETITQENLNHWNAAQENVIEKIVVNNVEQTVTNKAVNLTVPTKAADINAASSDHNHDNTYIKLSAKGLANGVAELGSDGKIPASQLPSYVDDVVEVEDFNNLPATGESGKIYLTTNDNKTYRWSGTQYVLISGDLTLGETESTAFRGDYGKIAYEHSQSAHAPITAQENTIELFKINNQPVQTVDKAVNIPISSSEELGVVKSSEGINKVSVLDDGTMSVTSVNVNSLVIPEGDQLVLDGGNSTIT